MKKLYLTIFFSCLFLSAYEQNNKIDENYTKESEDLKRTIWGWSDKKFQIREIPEEYKNYSKVIIAHHRELVTDTKSSIGFYGIWFGKKYHQRLIETIREVIKLNDRRSVQEYSEMSFKKFLSKSGFLVYDKTSTYIGIRIIKPNGSIKEINADEIVITNNLKNDQEARLAIPDLEPGDIIDYFFSTVQNTINNYDEKEYNLLLAYNAPIMDYSFHCQLDKSYALEYRSYNNAPLARVSKNEDLDLIMDLNQKNINPIETEQWVFPKKQLPILRMNIYLGFSGWGKQPLIVSKAGEIKEITGDYLGFKELIEVLAYSNFLQLFKPNNNYEIIEATKKKAKESGIDFNNLPSYEKAALLYYQFRYYNILNFDINNPKKTINFGKFETKEFRMTFYSILRMCDIDPKFLVCNFNDGYSIADALSSLDITHIIYLPENKKFIPIDDAFDIPYEIPEKLEGATDTKMVTSKDTKISGMKYNNRMRNLTSYTSVKDTIPISKFSDNVRIERLTITLNKESNNLTFQRNTTLKNFEKKNSQKNLITYEDFLEYERKSLNIKNSLIDELENNKSLKKSIPEIKNTFSEAKEQQKKAFLTEAKEQFQQEITDISGCKIENPGVRHTAPDFVFSSNFKVDGLIKKAGNNLILEIGKLFKNPLSLENYVTKRELDIYFPYAKGVEYEIKFTVPDEYVVEGLSSLNTKIENETGSFSSEVEDKGQIIIIKIKEYCFHSYEKAINFDKILQISEAAEKWRKAKFLLKRKN